MGYTSDNIHKVSFNPKKIDLLKVYQLCANELKGTKWEKGYYQRMIYTCAEYSVKAYGLHDKDLRKKIMEYYWLAVQKYAFTKFPVKERIAIFLEIFFPGIWRLRSRYK